MEQHTNCQCEFEDFKERNTLIERCVVCFTLDGRACIGGAHKRRPPAPAPGNYLILLIYIVSFTSHILHIYILFAFDEFHLID